MYSISTHTLRTGKLGESNLQNWEGKVGIIAFKKDRTPEFSNLMLHIVVRVLYHPHLHHCGDGKCCTPNSHHRNCHHEVRHHQLGYQKPFPGNDRRRSRGPQGFTNLKELVFRCFGFQLENPIMNRKCHAKIKWIWIFLVYHLY